MIESKKWQPIVTVYEMQENCLYCGKKIRVQSNCYVSKFGIMHERCWWKR
jgi:hypothetical protein